MNCRKLISSRFLLVGVALAIATAAFASSPQGNFDKTLQVSGAIDLEIQNHSGDVIVRSGPPGTVSIRGKIFVGDHWLFGNRHTDVSDIEHNPPIRQQGNSIYIDYVSARDISIDYEITAPADVAVRAHNGSGNLTLEGTHGRIDLESGSGDIKLSEVQGEIHLQTGSGNVHAQGVSGSVRGGSGSGDVELEGAGSGAVDLHSGSGNLMVRGVHGGLRLEAGSGDITAEGSQSGSWDIRTGSGNVNIRLPSDAAFEANLSTSSGSIDVHPAITMTVQGRVEDSHKIIRGQVRGGGPQLSVHTGSGDIRVE